MGTFFLALLFTSREEDEVRHLQRMMESYRWTLRIHSLTSPSLTDLALSRLDSLLTTTNCNSSLVPQDPPCPSHNSDPFLNGRPERPDDNDVDIPDLGGSPCPSGFAHEVPREEFGQGAGQSPLVQAVRKDVLLNDMSVPLNGFVDFDFEHWMREALLFGGDAATAAGQNEGVDLMYSL